MPSIRTHLQTTFLTSLLLVGGAVSAHEIPQRVQILGYITQTSSAPKSPDAGKPAQADQVSVLLRVPLDALRDVEPATDERGYLDLETAAPQLRDAALVWIRDYLSIYYNQRVLPPGTLRSLKISLPYDRSFISYASALAHLRSEQQATPPFQDQGWLDLWFVYAIPNPGKATTDPTPGIISIDPRLAHLAIHTHTELRYLSPAGTESLFQFEGNPGKIALNPGWFSALKSFTLLGIEHITTGWDHLLFVFCLILPIRRLGPLIPVVAAFTLAHSITLITATMDLVPQAHWFPALTETLIAASILIMALLNILHLHPYNRWKLAFGFGLIHGFGFSYALGDSLQLAGGHLVTALLSFNLGVELGQLLILTGTLALLSVLFRYATHQRLVTITLSALIAHRAWHWMSERFDLLTEYSFQWPEWNLQLVSHSLSWVLLLLVASGFLWLTTGWFNHWLQNSAESQQEMTGGDSP